MNDALKKFITEKFPGMLLRDSVYREQLSLYVEARALREIAKALKDDSELAYEFLIDICSVDRLGQPEEKDGRFEVIYTLMSLKLNHRFMLRVTLDAEKPSVPTLSGDWHCANWLEREVWDMMGIDFAGHPDLTKIVTEDDLEGHPLRKDFGIQYEIPQFSHNLNEVEVVPDNPNH